MSWKSWIVEFLYSKLQASKLRPPVLLSKFLKFWKIPDKMCCGVLFYRRRCLQALSRISALKTLLGKVPGRSEFVLKKDFTLNVLLGSMQKFSKKLFFQNTNGLMLPKVQIVFFQNNHPQPSTTTQNYSQRPTATHNYPKPSTITQKNHPQLSTTTHNHPQPPKTIHNDPQLPTTTQNHPQLPKKPHPKPSTTTHNHPKITQESQDLSQSVMLLHLRC